MSIELPKPPNSMDSRDYQAFYDALKKGTWRHKTSEADRMIGEEYTMLHWCALRAIDFLPDMLDSVSKSKVTAPNGYNACMMALENKNITWEVFEKLLEANVSPFPVRTKHWGGRNMHLDAYNPLKSLLLSLKILSMNDEELDDRLALIDYITHHIPEIWRPNSIVGTALVYLLTHFTENEEIFEKSSKKLKELRLHCINSWSKNLSAIQNDKSWNTISYCEVLENLIGGAPSWIEAQLQNSKSDLFSFKDEIIAQCGRILTSYRHCRMPSSRRDIFLSNATLVLQKLCILDKTWDPEACPLYFKNKERVLESLAKEPEYEGLLTQILKSHLLETLDKREDLGPSIPRLRL